jgi:mannobiose 2-epimerase
MTSDGAFIYEREKDPFGERLELWPQAESVVVFLNAYQISSDQKYVKLIENTWNWIKTKMIDYDYGE